MQKPIIDKNKSYSFSYYFNWRFGILDRENKIILRDFGAYSIPVNLEELFSILLGILQNKS